MGKVRFWGGSKIRCFWAVLKFISQEVPLERAIWCSSELTKGREHPAYVCKWKCQSKHGVSMLQDVRLTHPRHGEEWWRATERNWSLQGRHCHELNMKIASRHGVLDSPSRPPVALLGSFPPAHGRIEGDANLTCRDNFFIPWATKAMVTSWDGRGARGGG